MAISASKDKPHDLQQAAIGVGVLAGAANVIMQLAHPAVGYGVVESKVESGQVFRHPVKRARTTFTYLAVATSGTEDERKRYRRAVNRSHAQVRSGPQSPVAYNAFDTQLQLWVAACLYRGFEDVYTMTYGPLGPADEDRFYQQGATFGTTLQMPRTMWPTDRAAFEKYWNAALNEVTIDDTVREYLYRVASASFGPRFVNLVVGPLNRFFTTGFLPQQFRDEMRLPWSDRRQRRFDAVMKVIAAVHRRLPRTLGRFPFNYCLWDMRRRIRSGRQLV